MHQSVADLRIYLGDGGQTKYKIGYCNYEYVTDKGDLALYK